MDKPEALKIGDRVKVTRQIGKNGIPAEVTGIIERFNGVITINGEPTATIKYDDGMPHYAHQLSKITKITN